MIRLSQLSLPIDHTEEEMYRGIAVKLKIKHEVIQDVEIIKKSIDARRKSDIRYIYTVDVKVPKEHELCKWLKKRTIYVIEPKTYSFLPTGKKTLRTRPVIVGAGPAGLLAGLMLARNGYRPLILERGLEVTERVKKVNDFWENSILNKHTNVQFGEGGAGTFSDGKLNGMIKYKDIQGYKVLEEFVNAGADPEILYCNKPHIGTDVLVEVVKNIRNQIIEAGGEIRFASCVTDIVTGLGSVKQVEVNGMYDIETDVIVLAIGHSARDTFKLLENKNVAMQQKPFAIGLRIEHPQNMISMAQYGFENYRELPPADYKFVHKAANGRNVYSFCMCPGGYVVNASSEANRVVINGMSDSQRDSRNANSAIVVNVAPADYESKDILAGMQFQRKWEELAFMSAGYKHNIPVQLYKDFKTGKKSGDFGAFSTEMKGKVTFADLNKCIPTYVREAIIEGIEDFAGKLEGFNRGDAILTGVETRTSSPVKITRNSVYESNFIGLYPCGEGAGYAGGITSAAIDGIKVAEAIMSKYKAFD